MSVKVTTQGGTVKEISYSPNMTVADALKAGGISPKKKSTITVDGKPAKLGHKLSDGSLVVITPKVSNG